MTKINKEVKGVFTGEKENVHERGTNREGKIFHLLE